MTRDADWRSIALEELRFFGNVSALISHEINNKLAVINERAGLLEDLATMLSRGREVDPVRFGEQSRKIVEQVRLAKHTVDHLNRFAHSVDCESGTVDVIDLLVFVAALYERKAAAVGATLSVDADAAPVTVTGSPFVLEALVGRGLDLALSRAGTQATVDISASTTGGGLRVRYTGLAGASESTDGPPGTEPLPGLIEWLGAGYRADARGTELILDIPASS
jgi:C4-dicarboxylate-specific signal transduction histidine kinase